MLMNKFINIIWTVAWFQVTLYVKRGINDAQQYPINIWLIKDDFSYLSTENPKILLNTVFASCFTLEKF